MSVVYDFDKMLTVSLNKRSKTDAETLLLLIPGAVRVEETDKEKDRLGIDYIVTLRRGAQIFIDKKETQKPERQFWYYGEPELLIEVYSDLERKKAGWTFDESKITDYILYTFHPDDTEECYLIPFQLLRMAAIRNINKWLQYKKKVVTSRRGNRTWTTLFTYVPYSVLMEAISKEMRLKRTAIVGGLPKCAI